MGRKNRGGARQQRREAARRARKEGLAPSMTLARLEAFKRYLLGNASGRDFELAAEFMQLSGELSPRAAAMSSAELGAVMQSVDRQIAEGQIDLMDENGRSLL
ncbi:hypothetical protein [Leptolyngbya sp. FACHB-16]|uniref:hypothetical protein n=1 Tax=unclassified Leptolyngbya TaxID=2650499 RepID=UPI001688AF7E|nr:hypothetical protein [Leptolyngbya sp. FACHB-16]MBD2156034.1 hypothetical protein [Leptolyngbya sp. FACHB-16]